MLSPRLSTMDLIKSAVFGCVIGLSPVVTSYAQGDVVGADEAELRIEAKRVFKEQVGPFVKKYCTKCHGGGRAKANISFEVALKAPGRGTAFLNWKKAVASVKVHDMPPEESRKKPTEEERLQFIEWMGMLKYLSPRNPGPFVIRRLTPVEYGNTLHDLYGIDPSIAELLPDEVVGEGYLNSISPLQSELFLELANRVVDQIIAPKGKAQSDLQKQLFGDNPEEDADPRLAARRVAGKLARQAFRRPVSDTELDVLVDVFDLAQDNGMDYTDSLGLVLKAVLVSPQFLFITPNPDLQFNDEIMRLDDHQLASRVSYLLWAAPPDDELSKLADQGMLHQTKILKEQVDRLLKHPRARALFDSFGAQWLRVNNLQSQVFDPELFPEITPELLGAMVDEPRLLFENIIHENQRITQFIDSDYTFMNESLADLYGLHPDPPILGSEMRRVALDNPNRGGILGMSATLAATSFPNRTSPVRRGVWVLEQILGEQVPPPPPDVPELDEQEEISSDGLTLRQRTELHTKNPVCANCHRVLDPIGFGLENFDAIGRWREKNEAGVAIDSMGKLPSGSSFTSPAALKQLLAKREVDLARNFVERLMSHALGRKLEGYDEIIIDRLMTRAAQDDFRVKTIITEVITSYLFTHRRVQK